MYPELNRGTVDSRHSSNPCKQELWLPINCENDCITTSAPTPYRLACPRVPESLGSPDRDKRLRLPRGVPVVALPNLRFPYLRTQFAGNPGATGGFERPSPIAGAYHQAGRIRCCPFLLVEVAQVTARSIPQWRSTVFPPEDAMWQQDGRGSRLSARGGTVFQHPFPGALWLSPLQRRTQQLSRAVAPHPVGP